MDATFAADEANPFATPRAYYDAGKSKWIVPESGEDSDDQYSDDSDTEGAPTSMLAQMIAEVDSVATKYKQETTRAEYKPFADSRSASISTKVPSDTAKGTKKKGKGLLRGGFFNKKLKGSIFESSPSSGSAAPVIEVAKPAGQPTDSLRIPEVQAKMLESLGPQGKKLATGEWLTSDFMASLGNDPVLASGMRDPECQDALDLIKKNPAEAKKKYEKNKKVSAFMYAFMGRVGYHFSKLGEQEEKAKAPTKGTEGSASGASASASEASAETGSAMVARSTRKLDKGEQVRRQGQSALAATRGAADGGTDSAADISKLAREGKIAQDDPEVQKVLSDSQLLQILYNPQVMQFMEFLRHNPDQIRPAMADPQKRRLLRLLEANGLIRLEGM